MATTTIEGGKYQMSVDNVLLEAQLLGDISIQYTEGMKERETQIGTIRTPSGTVDTAEAKVTIYLPNIDYLKYIFPENYNAPTGSDDTLTGNLKFGGTGCTSYTSHTFNIHPSCETTDANDWHFDGIVSRDINPTLNGTEDLSIELTVQMQVNDDLSAMLLLGTGDLSQASQWDVTTQDWIAA